MRERNIDLAPLGLLPADDSDRYFCTPVDAELIFRTGVDGVHYCRVKGFGETVEWRAVFHERKFADVTVELRK